MNLTDLEEILGKCNKIKIPKNEIDKISVSQLILKSQFVKSRSEARRKITQNAVQINGDLIKTDTNISQENLLVFLR